MKKFVLFLMAVILTSSLSYGANCEYKCVTPYDKAGKFSSFIGRVSGANFIATKIGQKIIKKSVAKNIQTNKNLKIDLKSYSPSDLNKGIFKSLSIKGENVNIDGIYLTSFEIHTLCDFNYIQYNKNGDVTFKEDFPMAFALVMSADDVNNTIKSEKYNKIIQDLNILSVAGIKVTSTKASIRGNKFYYTINVSIPFVKKIQQLVIAADVNVKNGKIDFKNTRLASNSLKFDLQKVDTIMNYLNPLDFSANIFDNKSAKVYIKNIAIKNNLINVDGIVVVPKD